MDNDPKDDPFEIWWASTPENKLELIEGQLIISTLTGSRRIAWYLLNDYGPALALPLAPSDLWWAALQQAFNPQPPPTTPTEWLEWADHLAYEPPEPAPAGPLGTAEHRRIYQLLQMSLSYLVDTGDLGQFFGRDFVVRLGEDGLTPDILFADRDRLVNLHEYYLDGPPSVVIEIILEENEEVAKMDRELKRRLYETGGVPEYWLIEPTKKQITFLRLDANGVYQPVKPDEVGFYNSAAVPGLTISSAHVWMMKDTDWERRWLPFMPVVRAGDSPHETEKRRLGEGDELTWGTLPFEPRIGLEPVPIQFAEFISWCPEAKFEGFDGRMVICGEEGTQQVLAMLLMTFGMVELIKFLHPREWVTFLAQERYQATLQQHTEAFMSQAKYEKTEWHPEEVYFCGKIPQLPYWHLRSYAPTPAEAEKELRERISNWILLKIARREEIPTLESLKPEE
jgi:Uma2 family endonuclease